MVEVNLVGVSVAADGTKVCANSAGFVYKQDEHWVWHRNPEARFVKEIAAGSADHIWCRNTRGEIFQLSINSEGWNAGWVQDVAAKNVTSISVGADGTVWVANTDGDLFMRTGGGYVEQSLTGGNISSQLVERYDREGGTWNKNPHAVDAREVTVGDAGHVWYRDGNGNVQRQQGSDGNGIWLTDTTVSMVQFITAASDGTVWVSSNNPKDQDRLYRRTGPNEWQKDAAGKAVQGSAGAADKVWVVARGGRLYLLGEDGNWLNTYTPEVSDHPATSHVMKRGETLSAVVANKYKLKDTELNATVKDVADINGIADPDKIQAGQEILLP